MDIEDALENLLDACRQEVTEETKVSVVVHTKLRGDFADLFEKHKELTKGFDDLLMRSDGQSRTLARIRAKVDLATGYMNISGGFDEAAVKGRAAGAEGAVDRLIALYAGKVTEVDRLQELLRAAKVPEWVIKGEDREE